MTAFFNVICATSILTSNLLNLVGVCIDYIFALYLEMFVLELKSLKWFLIWESSSSDGGNVRSLSYV